MSGLVQDVRFAIRGLRRGFGFTAVAIVTGGLPEPVERAHPRLPPVARPGMRRES